MAGKSAGRRRKARPVRLPFDSLRPLRVAQGDNLPTHGETPPLRFAPVGVTVRAGETA